MKINQNGHSAIAAILFLVVFSIIGYTGWFVFDTKHKTDRTLSPLQFSEQIQAMPAIEVAAAGDIVCDPSDDHSSGTDPAFCQSDKIAELVKSLKPDAVLGLGDLQYENGSLDKFEAAFSKSWGGFKDIFYPAPGNHEYETADASGYFSYFKDNHPKQLTASALDRGYYSFNLGTWHIISLNSNCDKIGGCGADTPQLKWLEQDLEASGARCTLAFWHHPHFTSGRHSHDLIAEQFSSVMWTKLFAHKADIILNGHDHLYERFAPQTPEGAANAAGPRQFTIGTGGKSHYEKQTDLPTSEMVINDQYGVLKLKLLQNVYGWQFISLENKVLDSGLQRCIE
jgi:acid phosphatase type 7